MNFMQINGLLVTLSPESIPEREAIVRRLGERCELTVGELTGRWLPVAMEATDDAHAREIHDWMGAQAGVEFVDVVSVSFDDSEPGGVANRPQPVGSSKTLRLVEDDTAALQVRSFLSW